MKFLNDYLCTKVGNVIFCRILINWKKLNLFYFNPNTTSRVKRVFLQRLTTIQNLFAIWLYEFYQLIRNKFFIMHKLIFLKSLTKIPLYEFYKFIWKICSVYEMLIQNACHNTTLRVLQVYLEYDFTSFKLLLIFK